MEIHELRIGNYISFMEDGSVAKVTGIHTDPDGVDVEIGDEVTWIELDQFEPIKLTDKILLSCPEISICIYSKDKYILRNPDSQFHIIKHNGNFIFRGLGMSVVEVETVHYLQNLVYFNTKKELDIKL